MQGWECQLQHGDPPGNEAAASVSVVCGVLNFIAVGFWVVTITPDSITCFAWPMCHLERQKSWCALMDPKCLHPDVPSQIRVSACLRLMAAGCGVFIKLEEIQIFLGEGTDLHFLKGQQIPCWISLGMTLLQGV